MAFIHKKMAKMLGALTLSIGFTTAGNTSACGAGLVAGMTYANQQYLMEADLNMRSLSAGVTAAAADAFCESPVGRSVQTESIAAYCGYKNLGIANISSGNLNIREKATTDSKSVGKMTKRNACEILETEGEWSKIKSGSVTGYVMTSYLLTGEEAEAAAKKELVTIATVQTDSLRVREKASTQSRILSLIGKGEELVVLEDTGDWVKVEIDEEEGYISREFVKLEDKLPTAKSMKELTVAAEAGAAGTRASLVQYALQFVGNRYVWGGTSLTNGIDCSGFTMRILERYGVSLPHHAASQANYGTRISASEAKPGDLFFYSSGGRINHVAMYIGSGMIIHASNPRTGIKISNAYYRTPAKVARVIRD